MVEGARTFGSYQKLSHFIAERLEVDDWWGEHEYYRFSSVDPSAGVLEVIYPVADSTGRILRGAAGNGEIFVFLYRCGSWTYLGEMHGAKATPIATTGVTEFRVYAHASATAGVERRYKLRGSVYACVSEEDVASE